VKAAAEQFLLRMNPDDQGMVGAFNDKIEFHPEVHQQPRRFDPLVEGSRFRISNPLHDAVNESYSQLKPLQGARSSWCLPMATTTRARLGPVM
jgi:hypothetical protein